MGQEIGISPLQLVGLVSTFANDGIWVAPHILAGKVEPQGAPQTVAFHPAESHRVISSFTAAAMRSMMQKVILEGTARRALLDGYTHASLHGYVGTPLYTAPEQWLEQPRPASDQYALAIMSYLLLADRLPFKGRPEQIMFRQGFGVYPFCMDRLPNSNCRASS